MALWFKRPWGFITGVNRWRHFSFPLIVECYCISPSLLTGNLCIACLCCLQVTQPVYLNLLWCNSRVLFWSCSPGRSPPSHPVMGSRVSVAGLCPSGSKECPSASRLMQRLLPWYRVSAAVWLHFTNFFSWIFVLSHVLIIQSGSKSWNSAPRPPLLSCSLLESEHLFQTLKTSFLFQNWRNFLQC